MIDLIEMMDELEEEANDICTTVIMVFIKLLLVLSLPLWVFPYQTYKMLKKRRKNNE